MSRPGGARLKAHKTHTAKVGNAKVYTARGPNALECLDEITPLRPNSRIAASFSICV